VIRWALQDYLGITDRDPEPLPFDEARAREVTGRYENEVMTFTVGIDGAAPGIGQRMALRMEVRIKPEIRAAADKEPPPDPAPFEVGLLPRDEYIVTWRRVRGSARLLHPRRERRGQRRRPRRAAGHPRLARLPGRDGQG
jgi:hypothetical protein